MFQFFKGNVKATDSETTINSNNLDLLSSSDTAAIYNDVIITGNNNSIKADRVDYNFNTKFYHVSMYKNEYNNPKVKIKLTQWVTLKNLELLNLNLNQY